MKKCRIGVDLSLFVNSSFMECGWGSSQRERDEEVVRPRGDNERQEVTLGFNRMWKVLPWCHHQQPSPAKRVRVSTHTRSHCSAAEVNLWTPHSLRPLFHPPPPWCVCVGGVNQKQTRPPAGVPAAAFPGCSQLNSDLTQNNRKLRQPNCLSPLRLSSTISEGMQDPLIPDWAGPSTDLAPAKKRFNQMFQRCDSTSSNKTQ